MLSLGLNKLVEPYSLGKTFAPFAYLTELELTKRVKQAIDNKEAPPIVLAYGGAHWVVVRDYDPDLSPSSPSGVSAFYISDPLPSWDDSAPGGPFNHRVNDRCGQSYRRGHMYRHVAYSRWKARYATPCCWGKTWEGLYVAVCEGTGIAPPAGVPAVPPRKLNPFIPRRPGRRPNVSCSGCQNRNDATVIASVQHAASSLLSTVGLENVEPWATLLPDLEPGQPICVCRNAPLRGFYYLVPMVRKDNKTIAPVAVAIDGNGLEYEECVAVPDPYGQAITPSATIDYSRGIVQEVIVRWSPHQKSYSPFYPHVFLPNQIHPYMSYIRLDGYAFDELKVPEHGGA
jgi:hypothetical protein